MLRFKLQGQSIAARLTDKVHVGRLLTRAQKVERLRVDLPRNIAYEIPSTAGGLVACPCCMRAAKQAERHGESELCDAFIPSCARHVVAFVQISTPRDAGARST